MGMLSSSTLWEKCEDFPKMKKKKPKQLRTELFYDPMYLLASTTKTQNRPFERYMLTYIHCSAYITGYGNDSG